MDVGERMEHVTGGTLFACCNTFSAYSKLHYLVL